MDSKANAEHPPVLCIMGPTGSGKSALALELAERLPAEIVSVDSAMIYRGMDIGTDKPSREIRARIPHHLIDICDPAERYNAARFVTDATAAIAAITARKKLPILVGGTFLYFRALVHGLSPMPGADQKLRAELQAEAETRGWPALHEELARIDPPTAERIAPSDTQRLERALELARLTGEAPSRLHTESGRGAAFDFMKIALWPEDRTALGERLAKRFSRMLEQGLLREVEALRERGDLDESCPAVRAVGYRQLWHYLDGACDLTEAERRAVVATRRYAKRQMTWLRGESGIFRVPVGETAAEAAFAAIRTRFDHAFAGLDRANINGQKRNVSRP
ncbi:MAG: tRNA (adenosine(37)-N6)-dimethylallyltransferase MiaA [Gammaproteobacteria bacterium]